MTHLFTLFWIITNNPRNQSIVDERKGARVFFNEYTWWRIRIDFHSISACGWEKKASTRKQHVNRHLLSFCFFLALPPSLSLSRCVSQMHTYAFAHRRFSSSSVETPRWSIVLFLFIDRQIDSCYSLADHQLEWVKHFLVSQKRKTSTLPSNRSSTHSEPVTSKNSQKVENQTYSVGSSSMQGWRISKFDPSGHWRRWLLILFRHGRRACPPLIVTRR